MATPTSYQRVGATAADYDASAGPTFIRMDGVDDALASATFTAGTLTSSMDCLIAVRRDSAANMILGLYNTKDAHPYFGLCGPGSPSDVSGSTTYSSVFVDNVQLSGGSSVTGGTLHTALTVGAWHIVEFRGLDLSAWTAAKIGYSYEGFQFNGALGDIQLFASGQDANRDKARAQMAAYFGVTLA